MKIKLPALFLWCLLAFTGALGQSGLLQSGPMVGYSEMREVMLWVQTREAARVQFEYWETGNPQQVFATDEATTQKATAFVAKLVADQVQPGKKYEYRLLINKKAEKTAWPLAFRSQELWQHRRDAPDFKFAVGSCVYVNEPVYDRPGTPYGGQYEIFKSLYDKKPDFMLWSGDNIYLREADWNTRTGIFHRYTHTRSLPEIQPLLGNMHHYAIWDDHDFGPNDSDRSFWNKAMTAEAFRLFWANPNYDLTGKGGITGTFSWNDVQFFLLDDRYFRSPDHATGRKDYFGPEQLQWLSEALTASRATFKIIVAGGQMLSDARLKENYANFPEERKAFIELIKKTRASGVVLFSGDRHHSELTVLNDSTFYPLFDFTISPLTSSIHKPREEGNTLQEAKSMINDRNFAIVEVTGPAKDRKLRLTLYGVQGQQLWQREISASQLKKGAYDDY